MSQDFTRRISIVVNNQLPSWQVLNTVAHISAYFGNRLANEFGTDEFFTTKDAISFPRNSQFPIIVLAAAEQALRDYAQQIRRTTDVETMFFIREMIETNDDSQIVAEIAKKDLSEVEVLGVGIFGENQIVKSLTKEFKLWS